MAPVPARGSRGCPKLAIGRAGSVGAAARDMRGPKLAGCSGIRKTPILGTSLTNSEAAIPSIYLIEGAVGAGKSTFAAKLSLLHDAPHLNLDEWMVTLFSPDRPDENFVEWYSERKHRCIQQIWDVTCELLNSGNSAILELGLVQIADRDDFYRRVDGTDFELRMYLIDTPLEQRRQRVRDRNRQKTDSYKMDVSDEMFNLANSFWEEPTEAERLARNIEIVSTT